MVWDSIIYIVLSLELLFEHEDLCPPMACPLNWSSLGEVSKDLLKFCVIPAGSTFCYTT